MQWGAWGGDTGGMAANDAGTLTRLNRIGVGALSPEQGLYALELLLSTAVAAPAVVAVNPFDWQRFERSVPVAAAPRFESFIAIDANNASAISNADNTPVDSVAALAAMLEDVTKSVTEVVLPLLDGQPTEIGLKDPLMQSGLDSLGAVELRQTLSSRFGLSLPPTVIFDYPTVDALSRFIAEAKAPKMAAAAAAAAATSTSAAMSSALAGGAAGASTVDAEVVSSACDYPRGVSSAAQLWSSLTNGVEFQEIVPLERFDPELCGGGARTATFVADVCSFDAGVFRVSDAEAGPGELFSATSSNMC